MLKQVQEKWTTRRLPPAGSFADQTVVVTGGTSGLGLAAAVHFASLGAQEVVITCRDAARGEQARARVEAAAAGARPRVTVMELDMGRFASVVAFADGLEARYGARGVDCVVLNAGVFLPSFRRSPEGWEDTIQVNTLSTVLLALLLLPWLKAARAPRQAPPHIVFASSGVHADADVARWPQWAEDEGGLLGHLSRPENWLSKPMNAMYGASKLMVEYCLGEIDKLALGPDGEPEVIVNSVCPGAVKTNLARAITDQSAVMRVVVPIFTAIVSKSADSGARVYIAGALTKKEEHGKFIQFYMTDEDYHERSASVMRSEAGKKAQAIVWKEVVGALQAKVPAIQGVVAAPRGIASAGDGEGGGLGSVGFSGARRGIREGPRRHWELV